MASNGKPKKREGRKREEKKYLFLFSSSKFPPSSHERMRRLWCEWVVQRKRCLSSIILLAKHKQGKQEKSMRRKISMKAKKQHVRVWEMRILFHTSFFFFVLFPLSLSPCLRWCISMFVDALHKLFGVFLLGLSRLVGGFSFEWCEVVRLEKLESCRNFPIIQLTGKHTNIHLGILRLSPRWMMIWLHEVP